MADDLFKDAELVDAKTDLQKDRPLVAGGVRPEDIAKFKAMTEKHEGLLEDLQEATARVVAKNAALNPNRVLQNGPVTIHTVSNGFIAKSGNRAYGIRADDFDQLQKLMNEGTAPQYSGSQAPWEGAMPNNPQLPAPDILHACNGLVIIHQLDNCCLVAGTNGLYLAETPVDAMQELDKIFKRL